MKKIDFHIHTVPSPSDAPFTFSMERMKAYVEECGLDGIAITNHNLFDLKQFEAIVSAVPIKVFPGIEIDLDDGQMLLIGDGTELQDFDEKCKSIAAAIPTPAHSISLPDFMKVFPDLSKYLLIPHYDKKPALGERALEALKDFIRAGEVSSPKKFIYCIKDPKSLVPVCFSDVRIKMGLPEFPSRQTYIDAGEINFAAVRTCLRDKAKVSLSRKAGHSFFDVLNKGLRLSTGLNVVLGGRSTGKTFTLDQIAKTSENAKYIRQFELLQRSADDDAERFNELLSAEQSRYTQDYLKKFEAVVDDMAKVDLAKDEREVEAYINSLKEHAQEYEKGDLYSKAQLYNESDFSEVGPGSIKTLIDSTVALIDNTEYRDIIDRHISVDSLKRLALELMRKYVAETAANQKKRYLNDLLGSIRKSLRVRTAATLIKDVDLYRVATGRLKSVKFQTVVKAVQRDHEIMRKDIQGFQIVAESKPFTSVQDIKKTSGGKGKFKDAFAVYDEPYEYLAALRDIEELVETNYFKCFAHIVYRILNRDGSDVSGGERSEFQLLNAINDSLQFDMLLIDEPESSFDNLFLMNNVNELLKKISETIPVVVVTHNNTVGASIKPNYVIYTRKINEGGTVKYELYSGFPSDKQLTELSGIKIENLEVMLNCLEAGPTAYAERSRGYEILKD